MEKIKEFFFSNFSVRPKVIIYWTIIATGFLTVALLLTGCGLQNLGWQNLFFDVGPPISSRFNVNPKGLLSFTRLVRNLGIL